MKSVALIANGGIGDTISAFQCAHFVKQARAHPVIYVYARKEVFETVHYLFGEEWEIYNVTDDTGDRLTSDRDYLNSLCKESEKYLVWPDLLYKHPWSFPYGKYNCHPESIRTTRLLTHRWEPSCQIYIGLTSTINSYVYKDIPNLVWKLADKLPYFKIYCPNVTKWANKDVVIENFDWSSQPQNVLIETGFPFKWSLKELFKSQYCICADNGISHIAYQLGIPRLLLDPRTGQLPWLVRWRQNFEESIDINSSIKDIVDLVHTNVTIQTTTLLPRGFVMANNDLDWRASLLLQYD